MGGNNSYVSKIMGGKNSGREKTRDSPASDASNRIAAIHADASFNGIAGGLDSDEPGFIYFLIHSMYM